MSRVFYVLGAVGIALTMYGLWIPVKAYVAQVLIAHAWERSAQQNEAVKPWPWMDSWPVAQLRVPAHDVSLIAMNGLSGQALAFGPGHQVEGQAVHILAGHNDTHFRFLQFLADDDLIHLELAGHTETYRVLKTEVLDTRQGPMLMTEDDLLVLVTCYPFDLSARNGPLRYVVTAAPVDVG